MYYLIIITLKTKLSIVKIYKQPIFFKRVVEHLWEYMDFEAVKEPWNVYKLQDETVLKLRVIIISVIMEGVDEAKSPLYSANSDTLVGIFAPQSLIGEPSERRYTLEERVDAIEQELKFETIREEWAEYKLKDGSTLEVKPVLTKVAKTSLYDPKGMPLYLINSQPVTRMSIPKELREKLRSK